MTSLRVNATQRRAKVPSGDTSPKRSQGPARLVGGVLAVLLGGCSVLDDGRGLRSATGMPAHQDWFDGGRPADMDSMDWGRIEFARQAIAAGRANEGLGLLAPLLDEGFPPAYYEAGKLYEAGYEGSPADFEKAAAYYGQAVRRPSPILGAASLRLGRLYRDGNGVSADDALAYRLFRQAVDEETGSHALVALAEMLVAGRGAQPAPERAAALYSRAAEQGNVQAIEALARAYRNGSWLDKDASLADTYADRYTEALKRQARAGDVDAMANLAEAYTAEGLHDAQPEAHRQWLMRAAEAGHVGAQRKAGNILLRRDASERGLAMLRHSAQGGNVYAMADLGEALLSRSPDEAIRWLTRAADHGSTSAAATLGRAYRHGRGVPEDPGEAARWLRRASDAGHAGAAATLGRLYLRGSGVARDAGQAARYLNKAVSRGHAGARTDLAELLLTGQGIEADPDRAVALLRRAAATGDTYAANILGNAYLQGTQVTPRPELAEKWLARAADQGHLPAANALGQAYLYGEQGIQQDLERGHRLLRDAAEQGHAGAQAALGREYLRGERLDQRRRQGADYLYRAARQGHPTARLALAKAYLWANGLEQANQTQALIWLDTVIEGDSQAALETMRQLLIKADEKAVANTVAR